MKVHAVVVLSSHYHLLLSPDEPDQLVRFMQFVQTNIAKEAGELHDWSGSFWARRYRHVPVSDETEAQVARLRYVLENSVKENLVARPRDWPGVHSVQALLEGRPMEGVWYDRTALYEARCRGERVELEAFAEPETVTLSPLPCWQGLPLEEIRELLVGLIETIEQENDARRRAGGQGVLGVKAIRRRHPHERPKKLQRSPAPRFHAATREARCRLRDAYREFAEAFRDAAELLRLGATHARFPAGSFPPGMPYIPHQTPG